MLPIPAEMLKETGLQEGDEVRLRSRLGRIDIEAYGLPDAEVAAFAVRFMGRYREALQRLAE